MKPVVIEDLLKYRFISGIELSKDGKHAFFIRTHIEKDEYAGELCLLNTENKEVKDLASRVSNVFWYDNTHIVFSAKREEDCPKQEKDYYILDITGGDAVSFLHTPFAGMMEPMGNDVYLVHETIDLNKQEEDDNKAVLGKDYEILDEVPFWFNGRGFINKKRNSLFMYDAKSKEKTPVSSPYCEVDAVTFNDMYIVYSGIVYGDTDDNCLFDEKNSLFVYNRLTKETEELFAPHRYNYTGLTFLDDNTLYYEAFPFDQVGMNMRAYTINLSTREITALRFLDANNYSSVGGDASYGSGKARRVYDGELYVLQTAWNHSRMIKLNKNREWETVSDNVGSILSFDVCDTGIYMIAFRETLAGIYHMNFGETVKSCVMTEYFEKEVFTGEEELYNPNADYDADIVSPDYFRYESKNGLWMDGYVLCPEEDGKKHPAVFEIHGGPKVVFGGIFHHEMQVLVSKGYYVFYTNPRGADGRGEEFANLTGKMGTIDYDDLMEFVDIVCERYPMIDSTKIGICGGSYGGFMCNWMIGHTNRFAAAASQRSISNYFSKSLICDNGYCDNMAQMDTTPWDKPMQMWDHSPLKYVKNATTPTLFIQSDEDYRCHMSDAISMFTGLMNHGIPTKMVLFHKENHNLSRVGLPSNRIKRLQAICDWFDTYLKVEE
ncbi:MAG: S9 family peptidase [Erysipelotrichaceae bacterium]|nr:S9 family peptidase [Erysipelotrichaceae bacterium]